MKLRCYQGLTWIRKCGDPWVHKQGQIGYFLSLDYSAQEPDELRKVFDESLVSPQQGYEVTQTAC